MSVSLSLSLTHSLTHSHSSKDWSADTDLDNYGCNGGLMDNAFAYWLNSSHGDDTETAYPYKGRDGKCAFKAAALGASISSYKDVPADDEDALQDAVASVGPISVAIHAGPMLQFYFRGVFNGVLGMCPVRYTPHGNCAFHVL